MSGRLSQGNGARFSSASRLGDGPASRSSTGSSSSSARRRSAGTGGAGRGGASTQGRSLQEISIPEGMDEEVGIV